ncbi:hypothetical protein [Ectobacillus sp. sgz5001026]|uniref:hypothetical protein n=1 Tax=Ectobacillus sp. sgz5001026 TaxID=3242473 RepID=UPI0036D38D36
MGRGKSFHHKKKGHAPQMPKDSFLEKDVEKNNLEDLPDVVTIETYKNSLRKG